MTIFGQRNSTLNYYFFVFSTFQLPVQAESNVNWAEDAKKMEQECRVRGSEQVLEEVNNSQLISGQVFVFHVTLHDVYIASLLSAASYKTFNIYLKVLEEH